MRKNLLCVAVLLFTCHAFAQNSGKSIVRYLSGTGADHTVTWDFYCSDGMNSKKWTKIQVPSCWEQQGFGEYNYGHVPLNKRLNETGEYKYEFSADAGWSGKNIQLFFEGVFTDCEVLVNGKTVGTHQGAFYEFNFDISSVLKYGEKNLLEVKVKKKSDNLSINQAELEADFWNFGGIFRPVYLQINPKEYIEHVAIDARADGSFASDIDITGLRTAAKLEVGITDFKGKQLALFTQGITAKPGSARIQLKNKFANPKSWSPEFPNRYIAVFSLLDKTGKIIHQISEKIGFRTVDVRAQDGIYVNGTKIKFKGICAHTFHPDYGRTSSEKMSIESVNLMKDMNMNAVRLSHYPHDKHFMNTCDSLGLFVLDELTGWQSPSYDGVVGRKLLREMIKRDVNYPSVLFWDNGNEGGWNRDYDHEFADMDIQKREVLHPWEAFGKTITSHYINYDYLALNNFSKRQIFFPTEFLHGLYDGGMGAGLNDYWDKMWNNPLCAGGFLWVLADEDLKRTDTKQLDGDGNHAPDGVVGPYHEKEGSFYTIKEIWSPIFIEQKYITPAFDGVFNIQNRFHYTSLSQCKLAYRWVKLPSPGERNRTVLSTGIPVTKNLAPIENGTLKVPLMKDWQQADVLELEATDPHGRHIYTWTYPVKSPEKSAAGLLANKGSSGVVQFTENDNYEFKTGAVQLVIDKKDGTLKSVSNATGGIPLANVPVLAANAFPVTGVTHEENGGTHQVIVSYEKGRMQTIWTISPNGLVNLDIKYQPKNGTNFVGVDFSFPEGELAKVRWMGDGPYHVWKNRLKGVAFNVWEKAYNNTVTGAADFIYPEFKGYHSNLYWAEFNMKNNQRFRVYSKSEDIFLKLFNPLSGPNPENATAVHSKGDISFLNGIPAIGNKFSGTSSLGPESANYSFDSGKSPDGYLHINLVFDFNVK